MHIDEREELREQIAFADVVLLNKTDLATETELENRFRAINVLAKTQRTHMSAATMEERAHELGHERGEDIFRVKGVLSFKGVPDRVVFQGTHAIFDGQTDRPWGSDPRVNKVVFIERNLDKEGLESGLQSCVAGR